MSQSMTSRNNNRTATTAALNNNNSNNASLPREQFVEHRNFLMRSLDRNDKDIAAIIEVNRSIRSVKQAILQLPNGLSTLLDLGEGNLELNGNDDTLKFQQQQQQKDGFIIDNESDGYEYCIDFLLRLKLRRKLLNRLARRLHRVAHALDYGDTDVAPPGPPRYGDLRLHVDPGAVAQFEEHYQRQERAMRQMQQERERLDQQQQQLQLAASAAATASIDETEATDDKDETQQEKQEGNKEEAVDDDKPTTETTKSSNQAGSAEEGKEAAAKDEEGKEAATKEEGKEAATKEEEPDQTPSSAEEQQQQDPDESTTIDYEALKSYNDAYEKRIDPTTGAIRYTILDQGDNPQPEEDHVKIGFGGGIGATHRSMSAKEKQAEFKRWQTSLLSRIPEQPTFDELGMKNRVFLLQERRKRALEEAKAAEAAAGTTTPKKKAKQETSDKPASSSKKKKLTKEEDMDIDDEEEEEETEEMDQDYKASESEDEKVDEEYKEAEDDDKKDDEEEKEATKESPQKDEEAEKKKDEDEAGAAVKRMKPISLAAVPSFYAQDLRRIKNVHAELMAASMHDYARRRLEEVTIAYNNALRTSNELYARRDQVDRQLQALLIESRGQLNKIRNDYSVQLAVARNNWNGRRQQFEHEKLNKMLPSRWGQPRTGTHITQQYGGRPDQISPYVGDCVADIVDSVVLVSEGKIAGLRFQEPFVPPPAPLLGSDVVDKATGETYLQRQERIESSLRKESHSLATKFRSSEEERARCWKKMLKTKAEFDLPHHQITSYGGRGRVALNMSNFHMIPVPNLGQSMVERIPQEVASTRSTLPSYVPSRSYAQPPPRSNSSDSKYSVARVRERIAADGTVAPVSEPKMTKDGLYLRPAGRTRKGMEWDAVRGIWVPAPQPRP